MRRLIYLLLLALFVGASASGVSASTDCERWFVAYRQQMAHSRQLQRIAAARRRAQLYARRKLAGYVRPAPRPHPAVIPHPHLTRKQTLRHLDLACGVLPEAEEDAPKVAEETLAEYHPEQPLGDLNLLPADTGDLLAENTAPTSPFDSATADAPVEGGPSVSLPPAGGGPGGYVPTGHGTTVSPNRPPTGGLPSAPPSQSIPNSPSSPPSGPPSFGSTAVPPLGPPSTPPPPPAVVPEPGSYVFLLTGLAGAAGMIRRRFQA